MGGGCTIKSNAKISQFRAIGSILAGVCHKGVVVRAIKGLILYRLFQPLLACGRSGLIDLNIIKCFSMQFVYKLGHTLWRQAHSLNHCQRHKRPRLSSPKHRYSLGNVPLLRGTCVKVWADLPLRGLVNKFSIACKTLT